MLPRDTAFVAIGANKREIFLRSIYDALGPKRASSLPGLHAISGADVTDSFIGKAKKCFWNKFPEAPDSIITALSSLGTTIEIPDSTFLEIEK